MEIIPSINVQTFEEVKERIIRVESYVEWAHLDVTDGRFSKHPTWHNPQDLLSIDTSLNLEVHLMVEESERVVEKWLIQPVRRVIVHFEATKDLDFIINKCREAGREIGLAINPETFWGKLKPWFDKVDMIQILAVNPGPPGQKMREGIVEKITSLRDACPNCMIEIDGGVNLETIGLAHKAGANLFVTGSVFKSDNMELALKSLKDEISK